MDINTLRDELVSVLKAKYPKPLTPENRYINLTQQVTDFGKALQYHRGTETRYLPHDTIQHLLACIMVDVFMFSDELNADLEKEMLAAIRYFKTGKK